MLNFTLFVVHWDKIQHLICVPTVAKIYFTSQCTMPSLYVVMFVLTMRQQENHPLWPLLCCSTVPQCRSESTFSCRFAPWAWSTITRGCRDYYNCLELFHWPVFFWFFYEAFWHLVVVPAFNCSHIHSCSESYPFVPSFVQYQYSPYPSYLCLCCWVESYHFYFGEKVSSRDLSEMKKEELPGCKVFSTGSTFILTCY